jgi:hypothetical protein
MSQSTDQIENDVRETLESGVDIYQRVRAITLRALTERELDMDNIKSVVEAIFKGISAGMNSQYEPAKSAFTEAVSAIDDALEKTAEASKLAIEEAASRVSEFSHHDLNQATDELKNLEKIFLETLEKVTRGGNEMILDIARNFIDHARQNGTAVGRRSQAALETLNNVRLKGQHAVATTTSILAKIGGGILTGIAESLDPNRTAK